MRIEILIVINTLLTANDVNNLVHTHDSPFKSPEFLISTSYIRVRHTIIQEREQKQSRTWIGFFLNINMRHPWFNIMVDGLWNIELSSISSSIIIIAPSFKKKSNHKERHHALDPSSCSTSSKVKEERHSSGKKMRNSQYDPRYDKISSHHQM